MSVLSLPLSHSPFWWEDAPLARLPEQPVGGSADIAVIGAGYAGLCAALELVRAGRQVVIFDRQHPGEGGSTRNGGITSGNLRPGTAGLIRRFGEARAMAMEAEGREARAYLYQMISSEGIDCNFQLTGRFIGAIGVQDYDAQARASDSLRAKLGIEAFAVPQAEQRRYLGTDFYRGGSVRMDIGGLHPAKFHAGLLKLVLAAGATLHAPCPVTGITSVADGFRLRTPRGEMRASRVLVCTDAYTDGVDPWLRRRIVPVRSRIIATAELTAAQMAELMPRLMMYGDTRELGFYFRPSPDGRRILLGGRDGSSGDDGDDSAAIDLLRKGLVTLFPELSDTPLSHSWYGAVGMHRDMVPRIFSHDGLVYATGFCGSGVVWAPWLAHRAAQKLLGNGPDSAFEFRPMAAVPLFRGKPWFMPVVMAWYQWKDRTTLRRNRSAEKIDGSRNIV